MDDVEHVAKSEFILRLLRCVLDDDDVVIDNTTSKSPLFPDFDAHLRIRVVVVSKSALTDPPSPRRLLQNFCGVVVVVVVAPVVVVVPNMVYERLL